MKYEVTRTEWNKTKRAESAIVESLGIYNHREVAMHDIEMLFINMESIPENHEVARYSWWFLGDEPEYYEIDYYPSGKFISDPDITVRFEVKELDE